jgi:restriction endonuclease S subunit
MCRKCELGPFDYSDLGVRSFFKGAFARRTVPGEEFTWQKLFQVNSDDLIFSNIMAWEKGIALALPVHDGCVGNHRMLTCEARPEIALSTYLHHYFTTEDGFSKVYAASPGTAARNRTLTADSLMAIEVPTPPLSVQKRFVGLKSKITQTAEERAKQKKLIEALSSSMLSRFIGG